MELKVWVDGIQRVVCGASYSTTCQDVVLALASAMGRTGRFTLVEKWRDSERPLFPNEYPLQSLHKWGEYAGEIRFCLVQAETDLLKKQEESQQKNKTQTQTFSNFVNKRNPPQSSQYHQKPSEVESLKRSSTFSCAQRTNYAALPSSLSSSPAQKSASLAQYTYNWQASVAANTSSARSHPAGHASVPNGKVAALSSASSSDSSSRSSSTSLRYLPQSHLSSRHSSEHRPISSARGDSRELHPANMPETLSSYSVQAKDIPSYSSSFSQYSTSSMVPSQQLQPPIQYPHQKHISKPVALSSSPAYQTSTKFHVSSSTSAASRSLHSQQQQQSVSSQQSNFQRLQSRQQYPQNDQSERYLQSDQSQQRSPQSDKSQQQFNHSDQSERYTQSDKSQQQFNHSDQSERYTQSDQSQQWCPQSSQSQQIYPQNSQSQQLYHVRPAAQLPPPVSSVGYKNTPPNLRQHRERAHYRNSHSNKSVPTSSELEDPSKSVFNDIKARTNRDSILDYTNHGHLIDNVFDDGVDENHSGSHHIQSVNTPQKILNNYASSTQERLKSKDIIKTQSDNRSATLDRRNTKSKVNRELPSRSLSTGDHGDRQIEDPVPHEFDVNKHMQGGGESKPTFVDSAAIRHHKTITEGCNPKSSFTSAVAYIRNHGDDPLKSFQTEAHTRQQLSDSSQEHGTFSREVFHSAKASPQASHSLHKSGSITNGHNNHQLLQTSALPPVPFKSISSSQHKSAFTEVSPKSSHHESSSSLSPVPSGLSLDHMGATSDSYQKQNSQTSLEIEEYDLDQSFPDVLHGKITNTRGPEGDYRLNMFLKQHLDHGVKSNQTEEDRMQLLRTVNVQQERIKTQEAQINEASLEIAALEQEESSNTAQLEELALEICQLEKQETLNKAEIESLEKADYLTVLSGEQRREADIKIQVSNVREKQEHIESQIKQLGEEADYKSKELRLEEERIIEEKMTNEELERKTLLQIVQMKDQLVRLGKTIDERNKKLKEVETKIQETDITLRQKEEKMKATEEELQDENAESLQSSPLSNEPISNAVPALDSFQESHVSALSTSENGEAILKILEGRLSPHSSSLHPGDGGDSLGEVTSAQHNYKSAMAAKNPNGVWV